eukprot:scaffold15483_cov221-Alexandrium_tamarense.AAC.1
MSTEAKDTAAAAAAADQVCILFNSLARRVMGAPRSEDAETRRRAHPSGQDSPSCGARRRRWFTIGWITRMETMPLWHGAPSRHRITKCPTEPAEQHSTHYQATAHNIISTHCLEATATNEQKRSPSDFLKAVLGRPVNVRLNTGTDYRGTSQTVAFD